MGADARMFSVIVNGLWVVFFAYWIARSFSNKRNVFRQSRVSYLVFALVGAAFVFAMFRIPHLERRVFPDSVAVRSIGVALCAGGIAMAIWARRTLGTNWSGIVTIKQDHELIRSGVYHVVRHPIYTGLIVAALGSVMATSGDLRGVICVVFVFVMLRIKSLYEEHLMTQQFP